MLLKNFLLSAILISLIALLNGCLPNTVGPPLTPVERVDLARYTGRWYEIARYPHRFEKGCTSVTADYTLREDGSILVLNQCRLAGQGGKIKRAEGHAKVVDPISNAKLKVSFFRPFYGDYWILKLDEQYQYAIVGEPSRKYIWILSRTPRMSGDLYDQLVSEIKLLGYDPALLIKTDHGDAAINEM